MSQMVNNAVGRQVNEVRDRGQILERIDFEAARRGFIDDSLPRILRVPHFAVPIGAEIKNRVGQTETTAQQIHDFVTIHLTHGLAHGDIDRAIRGRY